ncbi:crotonase [Brevibacillus reuszeri]|uniref:Crotonase n=1 Tax=Brevibacillus reuszeri TaxID=54915 RepID=A0ABQ0TI46_9BACL|nr:enoyl-CoA hydratase-related protein [Brevibacillus reuszeri]MED1857149.1 enoyl-CoA hydratase-related protein [Brevibacillus reuszeri]GED67029.1 crotonase [Brevibacillus reuszeri]
MLLNWGGISISRDEVILYAEENGIATLTLNRPEALNALNKAVLEQLSVHLDNIKRNTDVKAVILTGSGDKAFSAGADIQYLNRATPLEVRDLAMLAVKVTNQIESLGKIVIAAINGFALGGGLELAESCALRIAVNEARLGHPEVRIGAVAGFGGTTRLPRLIGKGRAAELLLTGKALSAEEAYHFGLVNRIVAAESLLSEANELLQEILSHSPLAVNLTWEAIHRGGNLTLEESALLGADYFGLIASTEDFREGTKAFLEKTKPAFKGK